LIRTIRSFAFALLVLFVSAISARAQSGSIYVGFGTATDSSIGSINTLNGGVQYSTPTLGGLFDTVGGDVIFFHNLGAGIEYSFLNGRSSYAGLNYRPAFYDVNAVYQPFGSSRRLIPEIQGGVGRASLRFYYTPAFCLGYALGCRSNTAQATGTNYLEIHGAGGVRYYLYKSLFIRPQVDVRWVHNFAYFGRSVVPEFTVAIGYTLRRGK
jgi:hypothetical protein